MSSPEHYSSFEAWYARLEHLARERYWDIGLHSERHIWEEYYEDGDSPEEALEDDVAHG